MSDEFPSQHNSSETISFESLNTVNWVRRVCEEQTKITNGHYDQKNVHINLSDNFVRIELKPFHLVTLACLIWQLRQRGIRGSIQANEDILTFFKDDLHLNDYLSSEIPHINSESWNQLNLWKVHSTHALMYSQHVADYLKRRYFVDKDVSGLRVVLDELYANIADHSDAHGLAFSFIRYDEQNGIINIAFCDFGIGIKASLDKSGIHAEHNYIQQATTKGVTARSNSHNKGFGLDTVVTSLCNTGNTIKIFSGNELFVSYGNGINQRTWITDFNFEGTLICFDLPITSFDDADYITDFEL